MSPHNLGRRAFASQMSLHNQGFNTWIGKVQELSRNVNVDIDNADHGTFKELCKNILKDNFIEKWNASLNNGASSILRTYATFKQTCEMDIYLENVNQFRCRNAITKLRVSSHALEIERGRHYGLSVEERVCGYCHCIEDDKHFLFHCSIVKEAQLLLNTGICSKYSHYANLNDEQKMFSCLPAAILNYYLGLANSYTLLCDRGITITPAYWIIVALVKKMKWFLQILKFIRHSQNWDLSHNIIVYVLLECHHTKTIACHLFAEISKKNNRFYMFWIVFIFIYVPIRMYFICIAYYFVLLFMYILVFRIMFLSWLWILFLIAVFLVSNLMYCFFMLCHKWRNKQVIYI